MTLTKDILRAAIKPLRIQASPEFIEELLEGFCTFFPKYHITTPKRIAAFIAQAAHETCKFKWFTELGRRCYFSKYEPCTCIGKRLGNKELGHGYKYRGRGIFQLTGLYNYKHYGELTGLDLVDNPEIAAEPIIACHIACEYWKQHKLNELADEGNIREITRRINGGYNGLAERTHYYHLILDTFPENEDNEDLVQTEFTEE